MKAPVPEGQLKTLWSTQCLAIWDQSAVHLPPVPEGLGHLLEHRRQPRFLTTTLGHGERDQLCSITILRKCGLFP